MMEEQQQRQGGPPLPPPLPQQQQLDARAQSGGMGQQQERQGQRQGQQARQPAPPRPRFVGFPAGTGDCCAPKLLHAACSARLVPHSLLEFWYGSPPNTATRQGRAPGSASTRAHLAAYPACAKCETILGAMLCAEAAS
ncbi:hypothetical protein FOA52_011788 [Chlamydomonas sp. UWO 241]|nr:hypothetical protein FOA52_011788 [Chlamydomonas sp. UWO 241]